MPASTAEKIVQAARKRFKTKDVPIGDEELDGKVVPVTVTVVEISPAAMRSLKEKLWQKDGEGRFIVVDKDGKQLPPESEGHYKLIDGANFDREWLLATMLPKDLIDDVIENWPPSLIDEIVSEAKAINGLKVSSAIIAKNS